MKKFNSHLLSAGGFIVLMALVLSRPPNLGAQFLGRPVVLVSSEPRGPGAATTIQGGINMVAPGGLVLVQPGTYGEALVINKGLTLEALGRESGPVIVAPPVPAPPEVLASIAVQIDTNDPVTIRGITVQYTGGSGIRGDGPVDVTIERTVLLADNPPVGGPTALVSVRRNNASETGKRARLVVRQSVLDGTITCLTWSDACSTVEPDTPPFPQIFGIVVGEDIDAVLEGNVIRRTGGACIFVRVADNLGGHTDVDILDNDLDECYPLRRAGAIFVGPARGNDPSESLPVRATGQVNIMGNTIRNSSGSCRTTTGILYMVFGGRIERNRIEGVVQTCSSETLRTGPAGIGLGSRLQSSFYPLVDVKVRFNDIVGNAQAGLRVAPNMSAPPIDANCNWWGDVSGPSGSGSGTGDAVVVEGNAAVPAFVPFATAPIAKSEGRGPCQRNVP